MIAGGWNSQRRASITQQDLGHVEDALKEKEIIPGGWYRQREASNTQQLLALWHFAGRDDSWWMKYSGEAS